MAAKFFTGLEMTDPDPECVFATARPPSPPSELPFDRTRCRFIRDEYRSPYRCAFRTFETPQVVSRWVLRRDMEFVV